MGYSITPAITPWGDARDGEKKMENNRENSEQRTEHVPARILLSPSVEEYFQDVRADTSVS